MRPGKPLGATQGFKVFGVAALQHCVRRVHGKRVLECTDIEPVDVNHEHVATDAHLHTQRSKCIHPISSGVRYESTRVEDDTSVMLERYHIRVVKDNRVLGPSLDLWMNGKVRVVTETHHTILALASANGQRASVCVVVEHVAHLRHQISLVRSFR